MAWRRHVNLYRQTSLQLILFAACFLSSACQRQGPSPASPASMTWLTARPSSDGNPIAADDARSEARRSPLAPAPSIRSTPLLWPPAWVPAAWPEVASWKRPPWPAGTPPWSGWSPVPNATAAGERAAAFARSQLGKRYCWGGTGPSCYDCSGLTMMSWREASRPIPRTSAEQRGLPRVPMNALQAGDVLWRPGHVGLYVGDGLAVHAPGKGKNVQLQAADRFVEAHRPRP